MVYSSPFWLLFPDDFIEDLYNWNAEATVHILDILSAVILTSITLLMLISITFIGDKLNILAIDISWHRPSKVILKKGVRERLRSARTRMKKAVHRNIMWMIKAKIVVKDKNTFNSELAKPIIASLTAIPIIFFLTDQLLAMVISSILSGLLAYSISCKLRRKILIATILATTIAIVYAMIQSNIIILGKDVEMLELLTLSLGVIGTYLLILVLFLVPLAYVAWKLSCLFRNLKERKDPLLSLEGSCDL